MDWLPAAARYPYSANGGSWTDRSDPKGCLHTTESSSWPSYQGGATAPHATVMPIPGKGVDVRQHTPFTVAARALRNPSGGVETNRDYVFQFELIGTSAKGGPGYYWPGADDAVLADLYRKVIKPLSDAFAIPLRAPTFQAYPASYGESNPNRMSGSRFDSYSGWLGHQHVPENDHGDPGAFPWARMLAVGEDDMPLSKEDLAAIQVVVAKGALLTRTKALGYDPVKDPDGEPFITGMGRLFRENRAALTEARSHADDLQRQVDALKVQVAAITAATSQAVRDTLTSGVVQVDVNINDGSAP